MHAHGPIQLQGFPLYDKDRDLLARLEKGGVSVRICDESAVVLGRSSHPEKELFPERCREEGATVYRRRGGGCAVWLDPGNVVVSLVLPIRKIGNVHERFTRISEWMRDALRRLGLPCEIDGISDLVLGNRKIGGSALYLRRDLLYYSTTLLHHPDVEAMERYLRHPPREPVYRRGRSHRDFVAGLSEHRGFAEIGPLANALRDVLKLSEIQAKFG